jgi:integrase
MNLESSTTLAAAVSLPPGVSERRQADGSVRFQVRVRRAGQYAVGTFDTVGAALAYRATAVDAMRVGAPVPTPPQRPASGPDTQPHPVRVHDAAVRLCRGMVDGTIRTRDGLPYKPSVARKYEEALRVDVLPRIGAAPVQTLTRGDVQRLVDEIAAVRTVEAARKALVALRVTLRVCAQRGELDADPCTAVRAPASHDGERPARILTPDEAGAIIAAADAADEKRGRSLAGPMLRVALGTGLRLGEQLALTWGPDCVDLDAATVRVRRAFDRELQPDGTYRVVAPKTRASRRDVPLTPADVAALRRHRLATGRPPDGALVFTRPDGRPLEPQNAARRILAQACEQAGVAEPWPRWHDLRHAYATHTLAAGISIHAVAHLLGHADASLVLQRYGHALPDEIARAGTALAQLRGG